MAEIRELTLASEVRTFGWRVFELADRVGDGADAAIITRLRQTAATASRHLAVRDASSEERLALRHAQQAFRCLSDAVTLLDGFSGLPDHGIEASALANEAVTLSERLYDLVTV